MFNFEFEIGGVLLSDQAADISSYNVTVGANCNCQPQRYYS